MPFKSFLTSNLSNSQKQSNCSMIIDFILLMQLISPITLSLKTSTNPHRLLSLAFSQIRCIVSLLYTSVLLFYIYVTNCICFFYPCCFSFETSDRKNQHIGPTSLGYQLAYKPMWALCKVDMELVLLSTLPKHFL